MAVGVWLVAVVFYLRYAREMMTGIGSIIPVVLYFEYAREMMTHNLQFGCLLFVFVFFSHTRTLLLSSFWTSRGHRCRPLSPSVLAFDFYRA